MTEGMTVTDPRLGVNIDHIATLRQLRGTPYPDIVEAARLAEKGGARQITVHLREDRRHIQDEDVRRLRSKIKVPLNLEMAVSDEIVKFALKTKPDWVCLVPEKRQEVTTEGGLDLARNYKKTAKAIETLKKAKILVSCFVEPSTEAVKLSHELGADAVEFHTGRFCLATQDKKFARRVKPELERIRKAALLAQKSGLHAHAGHGFDYDNVRTVAKLDLIEEYNIGHAIVCRAAMVGLERAVHEMLSAIIAP